MKNIFTILLILIILKSYAQEVSISQILATAKNDLSYTSQLDQLNFLRENDTKIPLIDKVEFRTETNNFNIKEQEYLLRLSPNAPGEKKWNAKFYEASLEIGEIRSLKILNDILVDRYNLIVNHFKTQRVLELKIQLRTVLDDRLNILRRSQNNLDFDFNELIKAEEDFYELKMDLLDMEEKARQQRLEIKSLLGTNEDVQILSENMVEISTIRERLDGFEVDQSGSNFRIRQELLQIERSEYNFLEERAKRMNPLGFVQGSYEDDLNGEFKEDVKLSVGFKLPITSSAKSRLNKLEIDKLERQNDLVSQRYSLENEINEVRTELGLLFQKHEIVNEMIDVTNTESSLQRFLSIDGISPLVLLKIRESIIKKEIQLSSLEERIFDNYIDLLDRNGMLVSMPFINYLSIDQEGF